MPKSKIVTVPSKILLNYQDASGNPVKFLMFSNAEYKISLATGNAYYIQPRQLIKEEDSESYSLYPAYELVPGKSYCIKECNWSIPVEDIVDVKRVTSVYEQCRERFSEFRDNNLRVFTFVFNSYTRPDNYKIAVNEGNFLCLSLTSNGRTGRRKVYGYIEDIDDSNDTIMFKRYISIKGNRSIREERISIDQLLAIHRMSLKITDYEEPVKVETTTAEEDFPAEEVESFNENTSVEADE